MSNTMRAASVRFASLACLVVGLMTFGGTAGAQTLWKSAQGSWFTASNWTLGVPDSSSATAFDARVDNGGIAELSATGATVRRITVGALPNTTGFLNVNLPGGLTVAQNLHIGESGDGNVLNQGAIATQYTRLGRFGGIGMATASGNASSWSTSADFVIGELGPGTLNVQFGADVTVAGSMLLGDSSGVGTSTVALKDAGTTLTVQAGVLRVGNGGSGNFTLNSGAVANVQDVQVAALASSQSGVRVSDAGSVLNLAKASYVGVSGTGGLTVNGGGAAHANDASGTTSITFGANATAHSGLGVSGAGSLFESARDIVAGVDGACNVTVADGGTIRVNGGTGVLRMAVNAGSSATLDFGVGLLPGTVKAAAIQFGAGNGHLTFNHGTNLTLAMPISGSAAIDGMGLGTTTLTGAVTTTGPVIILAGRVVVAGSLAKLDHANLTLGGTGKLQLAASGDGSRVIYSQGLSISTTAAQLDLTDNKILTKAALGGWDGTKYDQTLGLLQAGYNGGAWNGKGLMTSLGGSKYGLGAARGEDIGMVGKPFGGITVGTNQVLIAYTLNGDANLDGKVGFDDLVKVAQNYGATSGVYWALGDFNYDGAVGFPDLVAVAQNYDQSTFPAAAAEVGFSPDLIASVPEPASTLVIGAYGWGLRRRSRAGRSISKN